MFDTIGIRGVAFVHSPLLNLTRGVEYRSLMHVSDWHPTILNGILGGNLSFNQSMDGFNMWNNIKHDMPGPRSEILHNIDPLLPQHGKSINNSTVDLLIADAYIFHNQPFVITFKSKS